MALYLGRNKSARCSIIDATSQPYYVNTRHITDFSYFYYNGARINLINRLDTSNGTGFGYMFYGCSSLTSIPQLDTSNGTVFFHMFYGCRLLTSIPQLDTSNGTRFDNMFYGCSSLTSIPQLDIGNATNLSNTFYNCNKLQSVSLKGVPTSNDVVIYPNTFQNCTALTNVTVDSGWNRSIYLHYSNNLTQECLHQMIENLADLTGQIAQTFRIGTTNITKIDEEHMTMLEDKNWSYQ